MKILFNFIGQRWFPLLFGCILLLTFWTRFYQVTIFPPSLYWEEVALGYDAYSVLKTGKDHLGNAPSLIAFESYGDYKPALYFFLLVPSIGLFGLNEFAVRLPTMIAGVAIVLGVGLLARGLSRWFNPPRSLGAAHFGPIIQCLGVLVTTLSPWAILFSRAAWESNVATAFIVWGVVGFVWAIPLTVQQKAHRFIILFALISFALAMYTYHSARIVAPLLAAPLFLLAFWRENITSYFNKKTTLGIWVAQHRWSLLQYFLLGIIFLIVVAPLILSLQDQAVQQRLAETSIFGDGHVAVESNAAREQMQYSLASRIFFHRNLIYAREFLANYLTHFDWRFLFVTGDQNLRHSVQYFGQLYLFEAIFIIGGLAYVLRQRNFWRWILFFWLLIANFPAAFADAAPHALRTLAAMPVYMILITFGIVEVVAITQRMLNRLLHWSFLQRWQLAKISEASVLLPSLVVIGAYLIFFSGFWRFYQYVYPKLYSGAWQYGYRQIVTEVNRYKEQYANISISREMDRPAMAYWFFSQTDPRLVQSIDKQLQKDQGSELQFQNIHFINFVTEAKPGLVAAKYESFVDLQKQGRNVKVLSQIKNPNGEIIWVIFQLN